MGGSLLRRRAFRLFGPDLEFDLPAAIRFGVFHPEFEIAELRDHGVDLHGDRLSRRNVLDRRQIDFEKADFQQVTFGVGYDLPWRVAASHSDEKNLNSAVAR